MSTTPIQIGSKLSQNVACASCKQEIPVIEAHCFKGKKGEDLFYCTPCKEKLDAAFAAETEKPNFAGAIALGVGAGFVAALAWYLVEVLTGYQLGYIALGAGYLVGYAVVRGAGGKRGTTLQLISALITLMAIVGASYFSMLHAINKYVAEELAKEGAIAPGFLWVSPFDPDILSNIISPMTLLIWGIGLYIAFRVPQARKV
jgi:hypothetical protein